MGGVLTGIKKGRKWLADRLFSIFRIHPDEITRIMLWMSFLAGMLYLFDHPTYAVVFVGFTVLFDGFDGAMARKLGLDRPYVDMAADRYSEFFIFSSFLYLHTRPSAFIFLGLGILNNFLPWRRIPILPLRQIFFIWGILYVLGFRGF